MHHLVLEGVEVQEVAAAIVQAVAVLVVTYLVGRRVCDNAVHFCDDCFFADDPFVNCVPGVAASDCNPLERIEFVKVTWVHDCKLALG